MYIYPKSGLQVVDPLRNDVLPAEGREVEDADIYWQRRLNDGDVTVDAPIAPKAKAKADDTAAEK